MCRVKLWNFRTMSLLIPTGKTLMKWKESNASVRKNFSVGKLIVALILPIIIVGGIFALKFWAGTLKHFPLQALLIFPVILASFLLSWFSQGAIVSLNELCVVRSTGRYGSRSDYSEIDNYTVRCENYEGKELSVIEFKLKDKSKFRINTPVERIIVPEDVNLDQIFQILRNKGIKAAQAPLPT